MASSAHFPDSAALSWTDAHLDLAYLAVSGRDLRQPAPAGPDGEITRCVSLPALREGRIDVVFATIYTEPSDGETVGAWCYRDSSDVDGASQAGLRQLRVYQELEAQHEATIVREAADLERDGPRPKLVLLMEGADPIRGPEELDNWFDAGLRMVGLTWAMGTRYAGGNARAGGLTQPGRELVRALDARGMIHDLSHLADDAFDAVLELATGPVMASHSNCRALLSNNQRHLRDDQVRRIAERGGMIGVNLFSRFLATGRRATIDDVIAHIERLCELMGGHSSVGLGSDMDGGFTPDDLPIGLDHPSKLGSLASALRARGWSDKEVRGFAGENWRRWLKQTLPPRRLYGRGDVMNRS